MKIASHFGQQESDAVASFRDAVAKENAGDLAGAIQRYRRAYRLWPALDSGEDETGLPSGVRAAVQAAGLDCKSLGLEMKPIDTEASPRFSVDATDQWLAHLDEHGYCVLADVAEFDAVMQAKSLMWDYLEGVPNTQVRRNDVSTWGVKGDWLPSVGNGIVGCPSFAHSAFCWHTRLLPLVQKAFAAIWDTDDLIVSFDSGNVFRPWVHHPEWKTGGSWWHVDQNSFLPGKDGRVCVQALVTFTDATPRTGGLCVIPGSHAQHTEVCERAYGSELPRDFVPVQAGDPALSSGMGRLVCAKAGDLLLWDSRCVHCNTPGSIEETSTTESSDSVSLGSRPLAEPQAELLRVAGYVCMTPSAWASNDVLVARKEAFIHNIGTNHWPHEHHRDEAPPRRQLNNWEDITGVQRRMIVGSTSPLLCETGPT